MAVTPSIVWFRDDLRLDDHPALTAAITRGEPVVAVFVLDEASPGIRPHGGAARWWLHQSLVSLAGDLDALGVRLVLRRGPAGEVLPALVAETGAGAVFWNRRYGQAERDVDAAIKTRLRGDGVEVSSFAGSLLYEPWTIATGQGTPYSVFTPFWRNCQAGPPPRAPIDAPTAIPGWREDVTGDDLDSWELQPSRPDWAGGLREAWQPGEASAHRLLEEFLADNLEAYADERDLPAQQATSRLSPHLRWGDQPAPGTARNRSGSSGKHRARNGQRHPVSHRARLA